MAYERTNWKNGDVISSEKLNKMESGLEYACSLEHEVEDPTDGQVLKYDAASGKWVNAEAGGGSETLVVGITSSGTVLTMDKTWKEIWDAFPNVFVENDDRGVVIRTPFEHVANIENSNFIVEFRGNEGNVVTFMTNDQNGYPSRTNGGGDDPA